MKTKTTLMRAGHRLIGMTFLGTLMLISVAAGGCMDQARTLKDQHALILEKAQQDRTALDNLIKLSMKNHKADEQRFDELQCGQHHLKKQWEQMQTDQSNRHTDLQQLKDCVQQGFDGIRSLLAERFSQARQAQQKILATQQRVLDRVRDLSETVGPLPKRTLDLESHQDHLMQAMQQRLNEVMTELHQARQENQQLSQANASLTLAVQGVTQNVDLIHKRQDVLVDLIQAKGEGVNNRLGQLAAQQGQVHKAVEGVHQQNQKIAQGVREVNKRQTQLTNTVKQDAARIGKQLHGLGQQNTRQLALQRRLNQAVKESNGALLTLQKASKELHTLLKQSRAEDQKHWASMKQQQQKNHAAIQATQQGLKKQVEVATQHLTESLGQQREELLRGMAQGHKEVMNRLNALSDQQTQQSSSVHHIQERVGEIDANGDRLVKQTASTQATLKKIQGTMTQAGRKLKERLDEVRQRQAELGGEVAQGQKRLADGMQELHQRSAGWDDMLTQLDSRSNTSQDLITGFEKQINATADALKLQTAALEHQQQQAQNQSGQGRATQHTLTAMNHALEHVRDLQVALQEQLANVRRDLKQQQASLNQALRHLNPSHGPSPTQPADKSSGTSPGPQSSASTTKSSIVMN